MTTPSPSHAPSDTTDGEAACTRIERVLLNGSGSKKEESRRKELDEVEQSPPFTADLSTASSTASSPFSPFQLRPYSPPLPSPIWSHAITSPLPSPTIHAPTAVPLPSLPPHQPCPLSPQSLLDLSFAQNCELRKKLHDIMGELDDLQDHVAQVTDQRDQCWTAWQQSQAENLSLLHDLGSLTAVQAKYRSAFARAAHTLRAVERRAQEEEDRRIDAEKKLKEKEAEIRTLRDAARQDQSRLLMTLIQLDGARKAQREEVERWLRQEKEKEEKVVELEKKVERLRGFVAEEQHRRRDSADANVSSTPASTSSALPPISPYSPRPAPSFNSPPSSPFLPPCFDPLKTIETLYDRLEALTIDNTALAARLAEKEPVADRIEEALSSLVKEGSAHSAEEKETMSAEGPDIQ